MNTAYYGFGYTAYRYINQTLIQRFYFDEVRFPRHVKRSATRDDDVLTGLDVARAAGSVDGVTDHVVHGLRFGNR
jgi:hypothetical protein